MLKVQKTNKQFFFSKYRTQKQRHTRSNCLEFQSIFFFFSLSTLLTLLFFVDDLILCYNANFIFLLILLKYWCIPVGFHYIPTVCIVYISLLCIVAQLIITIHQEILIQKKKQAVVEAILLNIVQRKARNLLFSSWKSVQNTNNTLQNYC